MVFKPPKTDEAKKLLAYAAEIERLEQENAALRGQTPAPTVQPFRDRLLQYRDHVPASVLFASNVLVRVVEALQPRALPTDDMGCAVVGLTTSEEFDMAMDSASDLLTAYFNNCIKIERVLLAKYPGSEPDESTAPEAKAGPPKAGPSYNGGMV